jgi:hypothetical protein
MAPTVTQAIQAAAAANAIGFGKGAIILCSFYLFLLFLLDAKVLVNEHIDCPHCNFCTTLSTFSCPWRHFYVLLRENHQK